MAVIIGVVGLLLTVTVVAEEVAEHPFDVTVTVKLPEVVTVMACVVCPLLQLYEPAEDAVSVTLAPLQKVVGPLGVTVAVGFGFTVTTVGDETAVHPLEFETVTV